MYSLSQDYEKLYELILKGHKAVAFVDYTFFKSENKKAYRDVCTVEKRGDWDISFYVRGTSYGAISDLDSSLGKWTEKEVFFQYCKSMNLGFIPP